MCSVEFMNQCGIALNRQLRGYCSAGCLKKNESSFMVVIVVYQVEIDAKRDFFCQNYKKQQKKK